MAYLVIPFDVQFLDENGIPLAGAAPTITIRNSAGTAVITSAAMTEYTSEGGAAYYYDYTPLVAGTYRGMASTANPNATQPIVLIGNAAAGLDITPATNVTIASFYNPQRLLWELIIGDSYTSGDDNGALDVTSADFPTLTGASILVTGRHQNYADDTFSIAGSVVDADTARLQLTSTVTAARLAGLYNVRWLATLADGTKRTLVKGTFEFSAAIPGGV